MVKDCLGKDIFRPIIAAGQEALDEIQESMSETERSERLQRKNDTDRSQAPGPSAVLPPSEVIVWGKDAPGTVATSATEGGTPAKKGAPLLRLKLNKQGKEEKTLKKSLYPVKELEVLGLDSSETDELGSSEEEDLEDEAARYEEERYGPRWRPTVKKPKVMDPSWTRMTVASQECHLGKAAVDWGTLPWLYRSQKWFHCLLVFPEILNCPGKDLDTFAAIAAAITAADIVSAVSGVILPQSIVRQAQNMVSGVTVSDGVIKVFNDMEVCKSSKPEVKKFKNVVSARLPE
ncbi:rCG65867 [Rattus norvegicus]|uniref:LRRGT00094 n=2 Tax=Rattus norvegicus TaxID=10116 RepID=A0A9K3Y8I6_RAT|nr:LRRGT00094 [Rattus norvegicus]EDL84514.1 rCG65867 [Rattus norvegicus]